jgi:hypothetical protein
MKNLQGGKKEKVKSEIIFLINKIYVLKYQMPIYEAEFLGDPTPIKPTKTSKKGKAKKEEESTPVPPPTIEPNDKPTTKTVKRKNTKKVEEPPVVVVEEEKIDEPPKKKQRKQKDTTTPPTPPPSPEKKEVPKPKKTRQKSKPLPPAPAVIIDGKAADEPPSWFKNYLLTEAKRRNEEKEKKERVPVSEVKKVVSETAQKKWNDGLTRDRVTNEVNTHMNRLYQQIHGRK